MYKVISYQVADSIDIKNLKAAFTGELIYSDSDELFYGVSEERYVYIFKYGVVSFLNYQSVDSSSFLRFMEPYCKTGFQKI